MIAVYIILAVVSLFALYFLSRLARPDGTLMVDATDPDDVKMELTGVNVLDRDQRYFILRVNRYKTSRK